MKKSTFTKGSVLLITLSAFFKKIKMEYPNCDLLKDLMLLDKPGTYENIKLELEKDYTNLEELVLNYNDLVYPTLTCGIITYNEERCLEKCLCAIKDEFDEIIIVDSGSTDNTMSIIQKNQKDCPAIKILVEPWKDDFSFNRNKIIENATSKWIYFIDSDNYYLNENKGKIKRIAKVLDFLKIDCVVSPRIIEHDGTMTLDNRRMFSLSKNILFSGKVHEEPIYLNGNIPLNLTGNIVIQHDGYNSKIIDLNKKTLRNIKLTKQMIEIEPMNPKWLYFYARELYNTHDDVRHIKNILIKAVELYTNASNRFRIDTILLLCRVLFETNDFNSLDTYLNLTERLYPKCSDVNYYRALIIKLDMDSKVKKVINLLEQDCDEKNEKYSFIDESNDHIKLLIFNLFITINDWDNVMETYNGIKSEKMKIIARKQLSSYKDKIPNII